MLNVSVVVPVYNPGHYLDDLLASLARQSMPPDSFEVIFVDDGSTDGTARRLDTVAAGAPNTRVIHIPNSGWPGRPRNIGIDAARGEFVLFVDHDDELGDEALERMYAYGTAHRSDVVVGREVRKNKVWDGGALFASNIPATTLADTPALLLLLTPHKMFRRTFLQDHGIRFLEGRRRLEDHAFVTTAYLRARVISVLGDYVCYYWHRRAGSAGRRPKVWPDYFASVRDTLDVVETHVPPGPARDRMLVHWYRTKGLKWLGPGFADRAEDDARSLFDALRELTSERFPPALDTLRPLGVWRVRAALLRAGRFEQARDWAAVERDLRLDVRVEEVLATHNRLDVLVSATLRHGSDRVVCLQRDRGRLYLVPPIPVQDLGIPREALEVTSAYERMRLTVYARHPSSDQRFAAPGCPGILSCRSDGLLPVTASTWVTLRPAEAAEGAPLRAGRWWLQAELTFGGLAVSRPVRSRRVRASFPAGRVTVCAGRPWWQAPAPVDRCRRLVRAARTAVPGSRVARPSPGISRRREPPRRTR